MELRARQSAKTPAPPRRETKVLRVLRQGLVHHQSGDLARARACYRKVLKRDARHADALRLLAIVDMQAGRLEEAERTARRACAANPESSVAHNTLGMVLVHRNRLRPATAAFERSLALDPGNRDATINLGRALHLMDRPRSASRVLVEALERDPDSAALSGELALVLKSAGHVEAAETHFHAAVAKDPSSLAAHANLGAFYLDRHVPDLAVRYLTKSVEIDPAHVPAWLNLGAAFRLFGLLPQALDCLRTVLALAPGHVEAATMAAGIMQATGDLDGARSLYDEILGVRPRDPDATAGLAELHEWTGEYEAAADCLAPVIESGEAALSHVVAYARVLRRLGLRDEAVELLSRRFAAASEQADGAAAAAMKQAEFTLGDLYDDLGAYERAWRHYASANARHWMRFDMDAHRSRIESIKTTLSAGALRELPRAHPPAARPVFIVGMPRSGTSLVEQILAAHPGVHACGESAALAGLAGEAWPAGFDASTQADFDKLGEAYLSLIGAAGSAAPVVTDKTPQNFLYLGLIEKLFPNARVIHCRRSPLDTLLSCFFTDFRSPALAFSFDLGQLADYYRSYRELVAHSRETLSLPVLDFVYEDLVGDQEGMTRKLLEFVGLDFDPACLDFHEHARNLRTASHAQVREPLYSRSVGRAEHYAEYIGNLRAAL